MTCVSSVDNYQLTKSNDLTKYIEIFMDDGISCCVVGSEF